MNYSDFIKIIKTDDLLPVYLFTGPEEYLMHEAIEKLKDKHIDPSLEVLNFFTIDGKEMKFDNILNACETLPFMSPKKIVVIRNISEIIDNDENEFDKTMGLYIEKLDNYLCLIIMDRTNNLKKTSKIYKSVNKLGGIVEFTKLKGKDINVWVEQKLKQNKKNISNANLNYFFQQTTYNEYNSTINLYDLENELLKVVNFSTSNEITKDDIDNVLVKTFDNNIFDLLASINKKDSDIAIRIFNEMYISNEPVQRILFMIIRQIRIMLTYKLYKKKGYTDNEVQDKLKIKPYEFKKITSQGFNFTEKELINALDNILQLDIKQKTSSHDEKLALEILIMNLCFE